MWEEQGRRAEYIAGSIQKRASHLSVDLFKLSPSNRCHSRLPEAAFPLIPSQPVVRFHTRLYPRSLSSQIPGSFWIRQGRA